MICYCKKKKGEKCTLFVPFDNKTPKQHIKQEGDKSYTARSGVKARSSVNIRKKISSSSSSLHSPNNNVRVEKKPKEIQVRGLPMPILELSDEMKSLLISGVDREKKKQKRREIQFNAYLNRGLSQREEYLLIETEKQFLYGLSCKNIQEMETRLNLIYSNACDEYDAALWPAAPLR